MVIISTITKYSKKLLSSQRSLSQKGFTLIELMIVIAVIGVIVSIAIPSYQSYAINTKRADMMAEMQQIATRIESNKVNYRRYDSIPLASILPGSIETDGSMNFPITGVALYVVTVTPSSATTLGDGNWTITAAPIADTEMANDGTLSLNFQGTKCRATTCSIYDDWKY